MMKKYKRYKIQICWSYVIILIVCFAFCLKSQFVSATNDSNRSLLLAKQNYQSLNATSPAYRKEALKRIIAEANKVAREMNLQEKLPINESNVLKCYISAPRLSKFSGSFGNITTSNYTYYVSVGRRFSFLNSVDLENGYEQLEKNYTLKTERLDTNAAFCLATQFLASASMDVVALCSNCNVVVDYFKPYGEHSGQFVPVYWVYWMEKDKHISSPSALVELFEPTKKIRQMRVNQIKYILRDPIDITDINFLLAQTNISNSSNP